MVIKKPRRYEDRGRRVTVMKRKAFLATDQRGQGLMALRFFSMFFKRIGSVKNGTYKKKGKLTEGVNRSSDKDRLVFHGHWKKIFLDGYGHWMSGYDLFIRSINFLGQNYIHTGMWTSAILPFYFYSVFTPVNVKFRLLPRKAP